MKKISTSIALAALLGAASFTTPADASLSKLFSKGKDLASKALQNEQVQSIAKDVGGKAVDYGVGMLTDYASKKFGGSE